MTNQLADATKQSLPRFDGRKSPHPSITRFNSKLGSFYCQIPNRDRGQLGQENADSDEQAQRNGQVVTWRGSEASCFSESKDGICQSSLL